MRRILSLMNTVGLRDWTPARYVSRPMYAWPDQVRVYANGNSSAFLRINRGKIVATGSAIESYESKKPITQLWPQLVKHVNIGVGLMYFGALDNQIFVKQATSPAPSGQKKAPQDKANQNAQTSYVIGEGEGGRVECTTIIPPDLYTTFLSAVNRRVPVEILDELTSLLALAEEGATLKDSGYQFVVFIAEHTAYMVLYKGRVLLHVGEMVLRQGEIFDTPQYDMFFGHAVAILGKAASSVTAEQVERVTVWDLTTRIGDDIWKGQLEASMKDVFPQSELVTKLPKDLIPPAALEADVDPLLQMNSFPLPLFAYLSSK